MLFRNLTMFRFAPFALATADLEQALGKHRLRELGPLEVSTAGFVCPCDPAVQEGQSVDLVYAPAGLPYLFCVGVTEKILPAPVVAEHLEKRIRAIAERDKRKVGAAERKRLKDEVLTDLLPKAFTKSHRTLAYLDVSAGWLVVDSGSRKAAESIASELRTALGSFPATPLSPEESPRALLTHWMQTGETPSPFSLGDECELQDPAEGGGKWVGRKVDLSSEEVREHLRGGMQAFRAGIEYADRLSFVLCEDLSVKKLRFLDSARDETTAESVAEVFASEFALTALEVRRLAADLTRVFRIEAPSAKSTPRIAEAA